MNKRRRHKAKSKRYIYRQWSIYRCQALGMPVFSTFKAFKWWLESK